MKYFDISQANLPDPRIKFASWILFKTPENELICFPLSQNQGSYFFHANKMSINNTREDDIFSINVVESPSNSHQFSNEISTDQRDCQIKIDHVFPSAEDLWNMILYLMPKYISNGGNTHIKEWTDRHLNILSTLTDEPGFRLMLDHQKCDSQDDKEEVELKLRKYQVNYNLVKRLLPASLSVHANTPFADDPLSFSNNLYKNRRHLHNNDIYHTPALLPDWLSSKATVGAFENTDQDVNSETDLHRVLPSLSTPSISLASIVPTEALSTPLFTVPSELASNANNWRNQLYTTPSLQPELPTDLFTAPSDLITPTPTLTFIISDTIRDTLIDRSDVSGGSEFTSPIDTLSSVGSTSLAGLQSSFVESGPYSSSMPTDRLKSLDIISSPTVQSIASVHSSVQIEVNEIDLKPASEHVHSTPSSTPTVLTNTQNRPPIIRQRIPKLRLTSGVFWRYEIPVDTFFDFEDGNTRDLKLAFSLVENSDVPIAEYFIQFDSENHILYALPAENHIGRHRFVLTAVDKAGELVRDELEISVVQHKLSRSFTHKFVLEQLSWNDVKYRSLVDAVHNLMRNVALLFGERTVDSIFVQKVEELKLEKASSDAEPHVRYWNIWWTNSSLKTYPCPNQEIQNIFAQLSDISQANEQQPARPSVALRKLIEPDYGLQQVRYNLSATCSKVAHSSDASENKPLLRNPLKNVTFIIGQVYVLQVPSDTFWSPKLGDSRDLKLELLTPSGHLVDNQRHCVGFQATNQNILGLTLSERCVGEQSDYRLIATDSHTGKTAVDTFVVDIMPDAKRNTYTYELTLQLSPNVNVEMDLQTKVHIATRTASHLVNCNLADLRVLRIRKQRQQAIFKSNYDYQRSDKLSEYEPIPEALTVAHTKQGVSTQTSVPPLNSSSHVFYEYVLTTDSLANSSACPTERLQHHIATVFHTQDTSAAQLQLENLKVHFEPDYELVYVGIKAINKCKNLVSPMFIGTKLIAENTGNELDTLYTSTKAPEPEINLDGPQPSRPSTDEELLFKTLLPVALNVLILLLIGCLVVIVLVKYRRGQDKNRFELVTTVYGGGETESFLQKGRVPVIFESDINPNHTLGQQVYTGVVCFDFPNIHFPFMTRTNPFSSFLFVIQRMTSMRQMNQSPYQSLPLHSNDRQRALPPPYK
jgi:hypothetical protein